MKFIIYRDMELIGSGGGEFESYEPKPEPDPFYYDIYEGGNPELGRPYKSEERRQKFFEEQRRLELEKYIYVILPDTPNFALKELDETGMLAVASNETTFKTHKIKVKPNNTLHMTDLKKTSIKKIQFLHSIALDKKEFEYLFSMFSDTILRSNIDLDEFGLYILGMREIYKVTKNDKFKIENIKNYFSLKQLYLENNKYCIFSKDPGWVDLIYMRIQREPPYYALKIGVAAHTDLSDFVIKRFTDKELKNIVTIHLPENTACHAKVVQWIKKRGTLECIDLMKIYFKNQDMFLSYDVDFNTFKIDKDLSLFENNIKNVNAFKILSRLLQRLDSKKRQEIKSHDFLFNDYFELCKKIYSTGTSFERLEPVLRKIHTYIDASYLYNALKSITSDNSLYQYYELAEKTSGAKILFFDENEQRMMIKIKSYKAMKALGSDMWCIQRDSGAYRSYKLLFLRKFFIYVDALQKDSYDRKIGFTVSKLFNDITHAHNDTDRSVLGSDMVSQIYSKYKKFFKA